MDSWADYNQFQQPTQDPLFNDILALQNGTYSFGGISSHFDPSYLSRPAEPPRKGKKRINSVINTPDGTQRRPITRVPVEIWEHILRRCIPPTEENDRISTLSRRKAPMQLTAITRGLRHIVFSMPELWATISLVPRSSYYLPSAGMLKNWLRHSKDRPLTISLALTGDRELQDMDYLLWKLAKWSSQRWEHLSIASLGVQGRDNRWRGYVFPRLKSVTIKGDPLHNVMPECLTYLVKHTDSIRALSWVGSKGDKGTTMAGLLVDVSQPLAKLTSLKLSHGLWVRSALNVLSRATMLQDLELLVFGTLDAAPTQPIHLLHLRALTVGAPSGSSGALDQLLPCIFTPNLLSLSLGRHDSQNCSSRALQSFFTATRCRLTSLAFHRTPLLAGGLHWILTHFTPLNCLRSLTIEAIPGVASPLSHQLIGWMMPSSHCLVPTLQEFAFNTSTLNASPPGAVASMIEQRCRIRPRFLRKVHIIGIRDIEKELRAPNDVVFVRQFVSKYRLIVSSD